MDPDALEVSNSLVNERPLLSMARGCRPLVPTYVGTFGDRRMLCRECARDGQLGDVLEHVSGRLQPILKRVSAIVRDLSGNLKTHRLIQQA